MGSSDYISIRPIKMSCSHARTAETQTDEPSKKIIFVTIIFVVSLLQGNEKTVVKINSNYVSRQNVVGVVFLRQLSLHLHMATECSNRRELSIFPAQGGAERDPDDRFMGTFGPLFNALSHGLRTPNEGINQR